MNRYRIWMSATGGMLALLLVGCMAPPTGPKTVHRAPNISYSLSTGASVISPYTAAQTDAEQEAILASQKVVRVGLLLPLSGRSAELGRALQDAATISLFDKYARLAVNQQTVRLELLPKDTGDTPEQAAKAAAEAIKDGAQFIIGPLFADATGAAAPLAQAKNIGVLSLSNDKAQALPGVYLFGFSPAEQTERIVNYALQNGKTRLAVLAPSSPLGETVLAAAKATVARQGLQLAAQAKYTSQGAGMEAALNGLIKAGETPKFDAILIPEGSGALDTILRGLNARGVNPRNVKFLGTGLWDDASLLRRVNLDSAWFASSPPELTRQFEQRFTAIYNYDPPRIASLTYDAVALSVAIVTSNRNFDAATLTNANGFAGPANGIFRLRPGAVTQRGLAVMQVQGTGLKVISSAPEAF